MRCRLRQNLERFYDAVLQGNSAEIKRMSAQESSLLGAALLNPYWPSPLFFAAVQGKQGVCEVLLNSMKAGIKPEAAYEILNRRNENDSENALMRACEKNHAGIAALLWREYRDVYH